MLERLTCVVELALEGEAVVVPAADSKPEGRYAIGVQFLHLPPIYARHGRGFSSVIQTKFENR